MASNTYDQVSEVFEKAKSDFLNGVKDPKLRSQLGTATTIDDIWDYTEKLQKDQADRKRLRGLKKIGPYIERLKEYAGVIEVFVQAKPDVLALIWGPIKLLLQISSNLVTSFDAILDVMKNIGSVLPQFNEFIPLFKKNERLKHVLGLFFQDILDFYLVSLKFFGLTRWKVFFESLWPARRSEIQVIAQNIEKHRLLLCNEITLSDILEAHTARQKAFEHYATTQEFQERQDFHSMETYICPPSYDQDLDRLHNDRCEGTGAWLLQDARFCKWAEGGQKSPQIFWLQGIPGAGKTYLASTVVDKTKDLGHTLFAFLSYRHGIESSLPILQSLIFQLASQDRDLRARDLKGNSKYALEILAKLLQAAGPTYFIVDGLDEVSESAQQILSHQMLGVLKDCPDSRLFLSSRRADRIERILKETATILLIDQKNARCIKAYLTDRVQKWLAESYFDGDACADIQQLLSPLAAKANGMFLYVRIVLESIEMLQDLDSIRDQLNVLPESLDEAYERILQRILKNTPTVQKQSKRILSWVACSPIELTRHEMEQALIIQTEKRIIPRVTSTLNTLPLCGPLVKIEDNYLRFVHFTVKEYLLRRQKNAFINEGEAVLDISTTCLTYLCSDALHPYLDEEDLEQYVASGSYRLLNFSHNQWAECPFVACRFNQISFKTWALRQSHVKYHERPFKCEVQSCEYSTLGFLSRQQCEHHRLRQHSKRIDFGNDKSLDDVSPDDLCRLLLDLVTEDQVDRVAKLFPKLQSKRGFREIVQRAVAAFGSLDMAQRVFEIPEISNPHGRSFIVEAITTANIPVLKWMCEHYRIASAQFHTKIVSRAVMSSDSMEVFGIWRDNIVSFGPIYQGLARDAIPGVPNPVMEPLLAAFWTEQHALGNISPVSAGAALTSVAQTSCSLVLAKVLVACGADVNYRSREGNLNPTPLHYAVRKTSADAAYLTEFLLLSGADPTWRVTFANGNRKGETVTPSMEPGAKGIAKWLGKTWDELVEWAAARREEQRRERSRSLSVSFE
ncbi:hypothetical protein FDECE_511 [Fusarium decemcellulare]|nr:hypothetical protein FDECE_511 [Fusarium decemcellulare]